MKKIYWLLLIIGLVSCEKNIQHCDFKSIETIYFYQIKNNGKTSYAHTVLIKDFYVSCRDSTILVDIACKYRDTIKNGKPCNFVTLYSSIENFIPGETSQVISEINKNCLASVWFRDDKPYNFEFYDTDGKKIYSGPKWKPNHPN